MSKGKSSVPSTRAWQTDLGSCELRHYACELRSARATALADAEGFDEILFAVERLGARLSGKVGTLGSYKDDLLALVAASSPASIDDDQRPAFHFERLLELVTRGRNDALHQGAVARSLTGHCVDLALALEEALMKAAWSVSDFMVDAPLVAQLHETVASVRRSLLRNAYSYLPLRAETGWVLVSDLEVAKFLRGSTDHDKKLQRLAMTLDAARADSEQPLKWEPVTTFCGPAEPIAGLVERLSSQPVLVTVDGKPDSRLLGLLTPFDLL